jgi:hypothetical protein
MKSSVKLFSILIFFLVLSCSPLDKKSRIVKKASKSVRKENILIEAQFPGKLHYFILKLRENEKFDIVSGDLSDFIARQTYEAGFYKFDGDSLKLTFLKEHNFNRWKEVGVLEKKTNTIILFRQGTYPVRLEIKQSLNQ